MYDLIKIIINLLLPRKISGQQGIAVDNWEILSFARI
jgi:hypothetical protein